MWSERINRERWRNSIRCGDSKRSWVKLKEEDDALQMVNGAVKTAICLLKVQIRCS